MESWEESKASFDSWFGVLNRVTESKNQEWLLFTFFNCNKTFQHSQLSTSQSQFNWFRKRLAFLPGDRGDLRRAARRRAPRRGRQRNPTRETRRGFWSSPLGLWRPQWSPLTMRYRVYSVNPVLVLFFETEEEKNEGFWSRVSWVMGAVLR